MSYLVFKSLYFDSKSKKLLTKEESFEIEKIGSKWITLKELNSINNMVITFNRKTNHVTCSYNNGSPINKVNKDIFESVYFNYLSFESPAITQVYLNNNGILDHYIEQEDFKKLLFNHERDEVQERVETLRLIMESEV